MAKKINKNRTAIAEKVEKLLCDQSYFDCLAILEAVKAELIQERFNRQKYYKG